MEEGVTVYMYMYSTTCDVVDQHALRSVHQLSEPVVASSQVKARAVTWIYIKVIDRKTETTHQNRTLEEQLQLRLYELRLCRSQT